MKGIWLHTTHKLNLYTLITDEKVNILWFYAKNIILTEHMMKIWSNVDNKF